MSPITEYLAHQQGSALHRLYEAPSSALGVFRHLPAFAQTIISKFVYFNRPCSLSILDLIVPPAAAAKAKRDQALTVLRGLHIITISANGEFDITANFRKAIRSSFEGSGNHGSFGVLSPHKPPPNVTVDFLNEYSQRKWDAILQYVVNRTGSSDRGTLAATVSEVVKRLLMQGGLTQPGGGYGPKITKAGFSFLLQKSKTQVWTVLIFWLTCAASNPNVDPVDMLSFLFMISTGQLGWAYDTKALSESRRNMLPDLVDFGLVYIDKDSPHQYFPTRLATSLTSTGPGALRSIRDGSAAHGHESAESGQIIVETTNRLLCYTSSPLQTAILSIFTDRIDFSPHTFTGTLSKRSVQKAVRLGITSEQIIQYLTMHAHEQMRNDSIARNDPILPPTITDQIRLWETDVELMRAEPGFLFTDFADDQEYKDCVQYSDELGILLWKSDEKKQFFASKHEELAEYLKMRKKSKRT